MLGAAPWCLRWSERASWSPLRLSLAIAAVLGAAFLAVELALGRLALVGRVGFVTADFNIALGLIALVAYLPGAFAAAVRGAERTLLELTPAFSRREEAEVARSSVAGRRETWRLRRVGITGAVAGMLVPFATNLTLATWFLSELTPEAIVHRMLLPVFGWFTARFAAVVWAESRGLAVLGRSSLRVDLLDLRPLAPLAKAGLRDAFLCAGALSLLLLGFRDPGVAPGLPYVITLGAAANVVLSAGTLWLAVRGGHEAIQREKRRANEAADVAIRGLREPGAKHAAGALADALAWKRLVADAPDWPIDFPTLQRFVVPLALPLASLLAGAFLEVAFSRVVPG